MIGWLVKAPGRALQQKFISLGNFQGQTRKQIEAVVGPPNSISAVGNGTLCQWMATGYHIAVLFDGDVCKGITHEVAV